MALLYKQGPFVLAGGMRVRLASLRVSHISPSLFLWSCFVRLLYRALLICTGLFCP